MKVAEKLREDRLLHIRSHLEAGFDIEQLTSYIKSKTGDPVACMGLLSDHALAKAMQSWFGLHDIEQLRQWCYVAARAEQQYWLMRSSRAGALGYFSKLLAPLLSNNEDVVEWYANYDEKYDMTRVESHKTDDFLAYQAVLALRGEWARLQERCERVIADPPTASRMNKYLIDHTFYLALSHGDVAAMERSIDAVTQKKVVSARWNDESGFTRDLIFTPAVIFAKIAWRHGYKVRSASPLVPAEWLPTEPLANYDPHYDFLR